MMSKPKQTEVSYWKDQYAKLLDELDQRKGKWRESERLLLRVISRVTAATTGFDAAIEPQLSRIRTLVRKGILTDPVRAELEEHSQSLVAAIQQARQSAAASPAQGDGGAYARLFAFLEAQMLSSEESVALAAFRQRAGQGVFTSEAMFFEELSRLLQTIISARVSRGEEKSGKPSLLGRIFGAGRKYGKKIDLEAIQGNLIALLDAVETPLAAQAHANRLLASLRAELDVETFLSLLQEVVEFLADLKKNAEIEQRSLEQFLADLTRKLIELEQQTVGMQELTKATEASSDNLHASFADHFENLRSSASKATELDALKDLLSSRLEVISNYLSNERELEVQRIREAETCMARLTERLQDLETEAAELRIRLRVEHSVAMRDCLTSLPNRMAYNERIEQEVSRWKRFHHPFCLLVWDIDHFKGVNDRFGHKAGDKALVIIGEQLATAIRETDFVARFGGEEFVMILSGADREGALKVAEAIRGRVEHCGFNSLGRPVRITISCGISEFQPGDTHEMLFERADRCLYRAKNSGRNRCIAG